MVYHDSMEIITCKTPGHEDKPQHGTTGLCQACYRREKRQERGLQKPGPKPDASKPFSRYNPVSSHHLKRIQCESGHKWVEGSYKVRSDGRRICLVCIDEKRLKGCPAGHSYEDFGYFANGWPASAAASAPNQTVAYRLKVKYGLTVEQFEAMLEAQDRCGLCGDDLDMDKHNGVCVDHDHACCPGEKTCRPVPAGIPVRPDCNQKDSCRFEDDIAILQPVAAFAYLRQYQ